MTLTFTHNSMEILLPDHRELLEQVEASGLTPALFVKVADLLTAWARLQVQNDDDVELMSLYQERRWYFQHAVTMIMLGKKEV